MISNLATDYIQKKRGEPGLFSFEYNLLPKLISNFYHYNGPGISLLLRLLYFFGVFLSLPRYYLNVLNFLLEQTFTNLPGCKDHGQDLLVKMPTSQSLPCFVLKLFFFLKASFSFSFFFCSLCFNCAQEMVDHHHHLFLWKNLGCRAHRARHYSLTSLVPQLDEIIFS